MRFSHNITQRAVKGAKERLRRGALGRFLGHAGLLWPPPFGAVNFGALGLSTPVSLDFGWDRGTPVDRYYIEKFIAGHAEDIRGRVLEIGDDEYSRNHGGTRITRQDILHVNEGNAKATLVGDLTQNHVLPDGAFDCIVLTQTLQLIFELELAVKRLYEVLKPGGVLLLTVPGISQIDRGKWGETWYWGFTELAIRKLFERHFGPEMIQTETHGNVFAATALLHGVAYEEVDRKKLDSQDCCYPLVITLRAGKPQK